MSLDLTGEPFPRVEVATKREGATSIQLYTRCRNGHIDIWYDSTDSDKCPLCAVREQRDA